MIKFHNKNIKKLVFGLLIGIGVSVMMAILVCLNPFQNWHLKLTNSLFTYQNPSEDIVIVAIDEKSVGVDNSDKKSLGKFNEWQRSFYAEVVEKIQSSHSKAIGLDILFAGKSTGIDQQTTDEILLSKKTDEFKKYSSENLIHPEDQALIEAIKTIANFFIIEYPGTPIDPTSKTIESWNLLMPLKDFIKPNNENLGLTNIDLDPDGMVRKFPLILTDENGKDHEAFGLKIAQAATDNGIDISKIPLENGRMLINYFAKPYSYKYISFIDIFTDNYDPADFENKIVLIGVTTPKAAQDHYLTPTNINTPTPGVEIHANIIQTLLEDKFLSNQTKTGQIIMIGVISIAMAITLNFLGIWTGIMLAIAMLFIYTGAAHIAYRNGLIINMVYPYIMIVMTYFGSIIYKYFAELRKKIYIKNAFGRYLSPTVMETVLNNPRLLHLGGTKHVVTVLFSDIAGFTTISEKLPTKDLLQLINEYLSTMTNIILKHEGTLDKYIGDAIMAYFGAPIDQADHEKRACEVALDMRAALPGLQAKWVHEGKPYVDFRVGINTGEVIIGNVGSESRFDYTIMGDEVNLGSRLEGANKKYGTHIMISEDTKMRVSNDYVVRKLDYLRVKGKDEPIHVYELVGRKGEVSEIGMKLINEYTKGIDLYMNRQFQEAYNSFKKALETYPEDKPSKVYLQRCDILINFPPPEDWDGISTMETK
ncbi:adenylate/guanylate cyclase domain-containing protein [Patescibacteria group bacterium]|nr:adenylate/guanylate cyclase domain-containing protein [Patescibacteria group bacterium]